MKAVAEALGHALDNLAGIQIKFESMTIMLPFFSKRITLERNFVQVTRNMFSYRVAGQPFMYWSNLKLLLRSGYYQLG